MKRAALALLLASCGGHADDARDTPAPAPARAPHGPLPPIDPRLNLAVVVPFETDGFGVRDDIEPAPPDAGERWLRARLAFGRVRRVSSIAPIADGWIATLPRDDRPPIHVTYRTIGDHGVVCWNADSDPAEDELADAECLAIRPADGGLLVAFAPAPLAGVNDTTTFMLGPHIDDSIGISPTDAATPADADAARLDARGSTIVERGALPDGFWVLLHWPSKHADDPLEYTGLVRVRLGGRDLACTAADHDMARARARLAVCRSLRIP